MAASSAATTIYDFGANSGDDLAYYLKKAARVVAVEANPLLCRSIRQRFAEPIASGRLSVENCVLTAGGQPAEVDFYLHKRHHVLGQFPPPEPAVAGDYKTVRLPSRPVMEILRQHGEPFYIKIDIEGYDQAILSEIFRNGIRPAYLSAESTSIAVLALIYGLGGYRAFKLVEGATVDKQYARARIHVEGGSEIYAFSRHSAGPFGEDVSGPWLSADDLFEQLAQKGLGWRDIHATLLSEPAAAAQARQRRQILRHPRAWLRSKFSNRP